MNKTISLITMLSAMTAIIFIAGCNKATTAQIGDTVEISYTASLPDGSIVKATTGEETLRFVVGAKEVIQGLDEGIIGMKTNKTAKLQITPEKAYGNEYDNMQEQKIAKSIFEMARVEPIKGQKTKLGEIEGVVKDFTTDGSGYEFVLFDMNPEYTYETLTYKVTLKKLEKKAITQ